MKTIIAVVVLLLALYCFTAQAQVKKCRRGAMKTLNGYLSYDIKAPCTVGNAATCRKVRAANYLCGWRYPGYKSFGLPQVDGCERVSVTHAKCYFMVACCYPAA